MLPIVLNPSLAAGLIGRGEARDRRAAFLADAGMEARLLGETPSDADLKALKLLFVAGLPEADSRALAGRARALGVLVNVEDVLPLCDFHVPAVVRRGDLLLTASTGGHAPGLARALRERLSEQFGPEWTDRMRELGLVRARLKAEGLAPEEVSLQVRALIARMGWL